MKFSCEILPVGWIKSEWKIICIHKNMWIPYSIGFLKWLNSVLLKMTLKRSEVSLKASPSIMSEWYFPLHTSSKGKKWLLTGYVGPLLQRSLELRTINPSVRNSRNRTSMICLPPRTVWNAVWQPAIFSLCPLSRRDHSWHEMKH